MSHAAVVARGWGKPAVVGAERGRDRAEHEIRIGEAVVPEGDVISIDGTTGDRRARRGGALGGEPAGVTRDDPLVGGRDPPRAARGARQRRQRSRRRQRPAPRRRGHRSMPDRAHVPRRRPAADRAAHDPRRRTTRRRPPRSTSSAGPSGRTSPGSWRRWTACRSPCACWTRRCTSSCPTSRSSPLKAAREGLTAEEERALRGGEALAGAEPDARHTRRAGSAS